MEKQLISVIIPIFNQARFIMDAIDSVRAQLWDSIELIIVNDGSTDELEDVLSRTSFPFRYFKQENLGPSAARNKGVRQAEGEFVGFLDGDDSWPKGRLSRMMQCFAEDPGAEVIIGKTDVMGQKTHWIPSFGASLFRKSVFSSVGYLDESLRYSEDQDWFLRAREEGASLSAIPAVTLRQRANPASMTFNKPWNDLDIHRVLKKSLDRRRAVCGKAGNLRTLTSYGEEE